MAGSLLVPSSPAATARPPIRRRFRSSTVASVPRRLASVAVSPPQLVGGSRDSESASLVLRHSRALCSPASVRRRFAPVSALESSLPHKDSGKGKSQSYKQWDSWTATLSGASSIPFLVLQMPQIILNARNLMAGNKSALLAVPWLGMFTGMLGNLSLVSYFVEKKEKEAIVVQTLGVVSIYVVFSQLAMAEAMSFPLYLTTSAVVVVGLLVNLLGYFNMLNPAIWSLWMDFLTVGGLSVLPQIMWSTFVPYIPNSVMPGAIAFVIALTIVIMARTGRLSKEGVKFVGGLSGWSATLLFMWMPVSQMWTNYLTPDNIKGLSAFTMLLSMTGNGLMIPRGLFIRDLMWFTGSAWTTFFYGYANLVCMFWFNAISKGFLFGASTGLFSLIGLTLWRDTVAYGFDSPLKSLKELVMGSKTER